MPVAFRLDQRRLLVDHLLQDLLLDAELAKQLITEAGAVGLPVGLDLGVVPLLELSRGDGTPFHFGNDFGRRRAHADRRRDRRGSWGCKRR